MDFAAIEREELRRQAQNSITHAAMANDLDSKAALFEMAAFFERLAEPTKGRERS
jgi:hypothetical protein